MPSGMQNSHAHISIPIPIPAVLLDISESQATPCFAILLQALLQAILFGGWFREAYGQAQPDQRLRRWRHPISISISRAQFNRFYKDALCLTCLHYIVSRLFLCFNVYVSVLFFRCSCSVVVVYVFCR